MQNRGLLGQYELLSPLGSGHFSKVVLGRHVDSGQLVAIKLRKEKYAVTDAMFLKEVEALAAVNHPNISKLIDHGYN